MRCAPPYTLLFVQVYESVQTNMLEMPKKSVIFWCNSVHARNGTALQFSMYKCDQFMLFYSDSILQHFVFKVQNIVWRVQLAKAQ